MNDKPQTTNVITVPVDMSRRGLIREIDRLRSALIQVRDMPSDTHSTATEALRDIARGALHV